MNGAPADTVVGSGPVALAHALFRARHRPVRLAAWPDRPAAPTSTAAAPHGVESVPAPLLALLLELGVHPGELDVEELQRRRIVAWEGVEPASVPARAAAHVERGALLAALWRRVRSCPDIEVVQPDGVVANGGAGRLVDARGRSATGAAGRRRRGPPRAWIATTCTTARRELDGSVHLAAAATGYGFRLGSARSLTVGWVGPGPPPRTADQLRVTLAAAGATWLLDGIGPSADRPVRHRVASLSLATDGAAGGAPGGVTGETGAGGTSFAGTGTWGGGTVRLGDASLARDALASQGLTTGLSDARLAARPEWTPDDARTRTADAVRRHCRSLAGVLVACRWRDRPAWRAYAAWVADLDGA